MPDDNELLAPPAPTTSEATAWYRRPPVASAVFLVGLMALLASILVVRPAATSDNEARPARGTEVLATPLTQATGTPEPATEVLGAQQESDRVVITAMLTAGGSARPLDGPSQQLIVDGAVRAGWRLEAPADLPGPTGFVSITLDIAAGPIAFSPGAEVAIEIRCVRGACADWRRWTPLPAGLVDERSATTLVARSAFTGIEAFAIRTVRDPGSYTTP